VPESVPVTVLIADDSDAYRAGMVRAVRAFAGLDLVGEVDGGAAALAAIEEMQPDIALLDVRMQDLDGLEICQRLRDMEPASRTRVLLLSAYMDDAVVARARQVGADGYLSKASPRRDICNAAIELARAVPAAD
jgi:two-component system nitrate/nitrite response regulator NarL